MADSLSLQQYRTVIELLRPFIESQPVSDFDFPYYAIDPDGALSENHATRLSRQLVGSLHTVSNAYLNPEARACTKLAANDFFTSCGLENCPRALIFVPAPPHHAGFSLRLRLVACHSFHSFLVDLSFSPPEIIAAFSILLQAAADCCIDYTGVKPPIYSNAFPFVGDVLQLYDPPLSPALTPPPPAIADDHLPSLAHSPALTLSPAHSPALSLSPAQSATSSLPSPPSRPPSTLSFSSISLASTVPVTPEPSSPSLSPPQSPFLGDMAALPVVQITPSLPSFGGKNSQDVNVFLARLDRLLNMYPNLTPAQKIFYLENACEGAAAKLVHREIQFLEQENPARADDVRYDYLKTKLQNTFGLIADTHAYRDKLLSRVKKSTETYSEYVEDVLDLCRKCNIISISDQIHEIHKGLDFNLMLALRPKDFLSVTDFVTAIHAHENLYRSVLRCHTQHALESGQPAQSVFNPVSLPQVSLSSLPQLPSPPP